MSAEFVIAGRLELPARAKPWSIEIDNAESGVEVYEASAVYPDPRDVSEQVKNVVGWEPKSIVFVRNAWELAEVVAEELAAAPCTATSTAKSPSMPPRLHGQRARCRSSRFGSGMSSITQTRCSRAKPARTKTGSPRIPRPAKRTTGQTFEAGVSRPPWRSKERTCAPCARS
jgi:hypothetical protein